MKTKNQPKRAGCYKPSSTLLNYLDEKLQIIKMKEEKITSGRDLSQYDEKKIRNNDRMKVHVLKKHIFESMANLTIFFEYIVQNPELRDVFEDDLKELMLGRRKISNIIESTGNKQGVVDRSQPVLIRLLEAGLAWNEREDPNNFRLELIHQIQDIIFRNINHLALIEFGEQMTNNIVLADIGRAWTWTKLFARKASKEKDDPDRPVNF